MSNPRRWELTTAGYIALAVLLVLVVANVKVHTSRRDRMTATMESEQAAVLALAPLSAVDVTAIADGEWDNPAIWSTGLLPADDQDVHIPEGRIVLIDHADSSRLSTIRIDGTLEFSQPSDTRIMVETIIVSPTGLIEIGSAVSPITGSAEIIFIDRGDFTYTTMRRGLVALGMASIVGQEAPTWDREEAMDNDGLTRPTHTERTIVFSSEASTPSRRGHVMLMHHPKFHVAHAAFIRMGRTNKAVPISATNPRGRYPLHFHRTGFSSPVEAVNIYVEDSPGWGITNHSSWVNVRNCTVYDVMGAAYVAEAGDERGSFENCLAVHVRGSGNKGGSLQIVNEARKSIGDYGHLGDGIWLQGPLVSLVDNLSVGSAFCGFDTFNSGFREPDTGVQAFPLSRNTPLAEQHGNIAIGSEFGHLFTWCHAEGSVISDSVAINCKVGSFVNQSVVEFHNPTCESCDIGHDGGSDYGGPSRIYGGTFSNCTKKAIYPGTTRWLSGHSIIQGPFVFDGNAIDIHVHQADPGTTELNDIGDARMSWTYITKGSVDVRERLFYKESNRLFLMDGKQAFLKVQHPSAMPWGSGQYAGKTNQQIFDESGGTLKPLGFLIPAEAINRGQYFVMP